MRHIYELLLLTLCASADRLTKWWAQTACTHEQIWSPWLSCELAYNKGVAFSIGNSGTSFATMIITLISIGLIVICCTRLYAAYHRGTSLIPWGLVIIGAVSNLIDRACYEGVIDFIVLHYGTYSWPTFNAADVFICTGVALIAATEEV